MQTMIFQMRGGVRAIVSNADMPVAPPVGTTIMYYDGPLAGQAYEVVRVIMTPDRHETSVQAWCLELQVLPLREGMPG